MDRQYDTLTKLAKQRHSGLDEQIAGWRKAQDADVRLWCGPGCGNCCNLTVNCTLPEALLLAGRLGDTLREQLEATAGRIIAHARQSSDARKFLVGYRQTVGPCPFLDAQANCTIYEHRPLACRALLATRPADWCGVNLAELAGYERDAFLAGLDRSVVAFPTHYAAAPQEMAVELERVLVIAMIRVSGFGVTGNLPLLVWLAGQPGFDEALGSGSSAFLAFLESHHANRSFLVQVELP